MDVTLRALNRFGLGARVDEARAIGSTREWLVSQLRGPAPDPVGAPALGEAAAVLLSFTEAQRSRDRNRVAEARAAIRDLQTREVTAALAQRVNTEAPFLERLVAFWSNHLCVSVPAKPQVAALAGHYERTVVRPHVLGRFDELVLASAKHPAMLFYLDNFQSIGASSRAGRQAAGRGNARGLNENYARELLELHTVGVEGGYSQSDVEQLARILTGWTIAGVGPQARAGERVAFAFRPFLHEPGAKTVMGVRYPDAGAREGERVIRDLCAHPSTATFVASKLVRHFVADDPPSAAVEKVARTFRESDGDLREVATAVVDLEEGWMPENRKFRTPQDWLVAVLRAIRVSEVPPRMPRILAQLRHALWAPTAPKGYGDTEGEWADPDALMNRAELARSLPRGIPDTGGLDPRLLLDVVDVDATNPLPTLLSDASIPARERVSLAIGGPAFQWR